MVLKNSFTPPNRRGHTMGRHTGFTLLEAIVAIVMFTFIILAVSQAFSVSVQATTRSQRRQEEDGTVRAVFDVITRDILAAYASAQSPASVFTAGSGSSSGGSASSDLLTFSALSNRLQTPEIDTQAADGSQSGAQNGAQGTSQPQSDMALVKYSFDTAAGKLYRIVSPVPSSQSLSASPTPDQAIADRIESIQLSFWDSTQQNWRPNWDYAQQNQVGVVLVGSAGSGAASSATGSSSTSSGASGAQSGQGTPNTTATGDTSLPSAVKVTVTVKQSNGQTKDYITTIPISAFQTYLDPNLTANINSNPPTSSGSGSSAGKP